MVLGLLGLAYATFAWSQPVTLSPVFGESIEVSTGFVRVVLPAGMTRPRAEDFEVSWKGKAQHVLRLVGGASDPLEVGIAVDRSASMHSSFEPMRRSILALVDQGISERDRVFVVGFTEQAHLLAEGRGSALRVLDALPSDPEPGVRPTALFESLRRTLQLFENADARTALLVVSDGCDTSEGLASGTSVARRASDLSIPLFLLLPDRSECRRTTCKVDASGNWDCSPGHSPRIEEPYAYDKSDPRSRTMEVSHDYLANAPTEERDRFSGLISKNDGATFVVGDPEEWQRGLKEIFERLGRQWTVVFKPSSGEVRSSEVKVYATISGHRRRLR